MPWREWSVIEERLQFVIQASREGCCIKDLCAEFGISRQTGYVWLKRYRAGGHSEMGNRSRRPRESPRKSSVAIERAVVELRRKWPDWGAPKLSKILSQQSPAMLVQMRTVHRILERHGMIAPQDRRRPAVKRFERGEPNELWQMDFKGPQGSSAHSAVGPLSVMDDHSRYLVALHHLGSTKLEGVRRSLKETFGAVGMPDSMLMDHGTPWWNAASPWGLTELSIWIMQLGIRLIYSGICHPQTQGKVERMHGALQRAVRKRKGNLEDQNWLDEFRAEYNNLRPHEALGMSTPVSSWRPSSRALPQQVKEWEYPSTAECVLLGCDGQLCWQGRRWEISNALRRQVVGIEIIGERAIVYFCRTPMRELDLKTGATSYIIGRPIRFLHC